MYVLKSGIWYKDSELNIPKTTYRLPYMGEEYASVLKADVYIDINYFAKLFPYDTIKYVFSIVDRKLHMSNIDSTDIIVFR
ncbi:MAG: hypothetical protein IPO21_18665 [Bacteroidales bacterium]|nr:hypothetical protein [Bacteroidales bacterium]